MTLNALSLKSMPIYGDGLQIRNWLYVGDHCSALRRVLNAGHVGQTYNVGGRNEKPNLEVVTTIGTILDQLSPRVDRRYAIDAGRLACGLSWMPAETFERGIRKTVEWYLASPEWAANAMNGACRNWLDMQYAGEYGIPTSEPAF